MGGILVSFDDDSLCGLRCYAQLQKKNSLFASLVLSSLLVGQPGQVCCNESCGLCTWPWENMGELYFAVAAVFSAVLVVPSSSL